MPSKPLTLPSWRRTVSELYAAVRAHVAGGGDPAHAHRIWREGRDHLFGTHPDSPMLPSTPRATFAGLSYAPYDPALRWTLPLETDVEPARREVPTATDGVVPFERRRPGRAARGPRQPRRVVAGRRTAAGSSSRCKDATSGRTTYGGGRYLLDTVKGADLGGEPDGSALVIDLNFAYQPSCAYDPAWACPLAPPGNTLPGRVEAGELYVGEPAQRQREQVAPVTPGPCCSASPEPPAPGRHRRCRPSC